MSRLIKYLQNKKIMPCYFYTLIIFDNYFKLSNVSNYMVKYTMSNYFTQNPVTFV